MRIFGYALLAAPLAAFTGAMIAVNGLAFAIGVWAIVAAVLFCVIVGTYLSAN